MVRVVDLTGGVLAQRDKTQKVRDLATKYFSGCECSIPFDGFVYITNPGANLSSHFATIFVCQDSMNLEDPAYEEKSEKFGEEYEARFLTSSQERGLLGKLLNLSPKTVLRKSFQIQTDYSRRE